MLKEIPAQLVADLRVALDFEADETVIEYCRRNELTSIEVFEMPGARWFEISTFSTYDGEWNGMAAPTKTPEGIRYDIRWDENEGEF